MIRQGGFLFLLFLGILAAITAWHVYRDALDTLPRSAFAASLFMMAMLSLAILQQARERQHVATKVEEQTRKLRQTALTIMEQESRLRAIFNHSVDGLITIRDNGAIESFNPACERIFGYKAAEVIGNNLSMLMPEPYHSEHDRYLRNYLETGDAKIIGIGREVRARRKDGTVFPIDLGVSEIKFGDNRLFCGLIRDITEKKAIENERERLIRQLAASNEELERFACIASHDLKAPLRAIDNLSQWIQEDLRERVSGKPIEHLDILRKRVRRMEQLLDDILEYARVGRQTDTGAPQTIDGKTLMDDIRALANPPAGFRILVAPEVERLRLPRMPLQQVLQNLIDNAIKHRARDDGRVEIAVREEEYQYVFSVHDDGPGIAPEHHQRIFEMFQTLKSRDHTEGSGMGLALVKKIVASLGGEVSVESAPGAGCTFRFTWPKPETAEGAPVMAA